MPFEFCNQVSTSWWMSCKSFLNPSTFACRSRAVTSSCLASSLRLVMFLLKQQRCWIWRQTGSISLTFATMSATSATSLALSKSMSTKRMNIYNVPSVSEWSSACTAKREKIETGERRAITSSLDGMLQCCFKTDASFSELSNYFPSLHGVRRERERKGMRLIVWRDKKGKFRYHNL